MKRIILVAIVALFTIAAKAQTGEIVLNNQNITTAITGKWKVGNIQPSDKVCNLTFINVKGPGFGEIGKKKDGKEVAVVSKIYAANNNQVVVADADGQRVSYSIKSLTATTMVLVDGAVSITLYKQ
ncbi:MAG: hypothetical protein RL660_821 [Bacteroidota bacterium]|jgi:hypothetical protein